jgi:hypothetical protein
MKAVIFTHPSDYPAARVCAAGLERLGLSVVFSVDAADDASDLPLPHRTTEPRNGNLRGNRWVLAQLRALRDIAGADEWILKVDSDTAVLSLEWMKMATPETIMLGADVPKAPGAIYGCCYALRVAAISELITKAAALPACADSYEDGMTARLAGSGATAIPFAPKGGVWAGYNWNTTQPDSVWAEKFQIIHVDRPNHNRGPVTAKLRSLLQLLS